LCVCYQYIPATKIKENILYASKKIGYGVQGTGDGVERKSMGVEGYGEEKTASAVEVTNLHSNGYKII
jgi:hypothetical protein